MQVVTELKNRGVQDIFIACVDGLKGFPEGALVRTLGGELDVVADPEVVGGRVARGGVISGSFWLSGRLLDYPGQSPLGRANLEIRAHLRDEKVSSDPGAD